MTAQIQISGKAANGIIFVVGGENYDDFYANLLATLGNTAEVDATIAAARQLISASPTSAAPAQSAPQQQTQQQPVAAADSNAPVCAHGTRVWKEGISSKNNKPWKMWACPSQDRNAQCEPSWVR